MNRKTTMEPVAESSPALYAEDTCRELHDRLSKVEGQLRGVGRMIDARRPAAEVLQQLASVRAAVKGITKAVMKAYIERCASEVVKSGDADSLDAMLETLVKFVKE